MKDHENKINLVLLPGLLSNQKVWQHQINHLAEVVNVTVINLDDEDSADALVKKVLTQAPKTFALAGHSMGGWLALEIMRVAKDRVNKLCLLNTTAEKDSKQKHDRRLQMISTVKQGQFLEIAKQICDAFVMQQSIKSQVLQMFLDVGEQAFIKQQKVMLNRDDVKPILPTIQCPTLIIHAAQDKNFSFVEHQTMANKIPHAKFSVIEDSGHMSPMEYPQAVTALMRLWLTEL